MLSPLAAHGLCLLLVAADLLARAVRIRLILTGLGQPVRFAQAMVVNLYGDAGCALTPMRIAGEPARFGALLDAGVPLRPAAAAIALEIAAAWPVILAVAGFLVVRWGESWASLALPSLLEAGLRWWLIGTTVVLVVVALVLAWWRRRHPAEGRPTLGEVVGEWRRRIPIGALLASAPLTAVNVIGRTALLPLLVLTIPTAPPLGAVIVGSFALLYSQLILPTPSGVGPVELGLLAGAAGPLGGSGVTILLWWRFYSVGLGAALGVVLAVRRFGWSLGRAVRRSGSPPTEG